ncbi:MAG TPA: DEAD/DEAH box helicase [Terracidiphilus sp.]|nr:DEAD/DEAH box helicase [Terracidiphilus sp.]
MLASTGTGSGKTEIFLLNILGSLAIEGTDRSKEVRGRLGMRALLLYPMNALVTDQLSRVRRILGDPAISDALKEMFGRRIRFGMYTSRTPFPGAFTPSKCRSQIKPLFEKYYLKYGCDARVLKLLKEKGRWPAKDLKKFYAEHLGDDWMQRLQTSEDDCELLARHEMQQTCPDVLITNYSMLEYMMLRPIERSIFAQTKDWLHSDNKNYLTLVLDEAHMYRGTGGAEVAMLIRRLAARLEIPRSRLRCILTSASLGKKDDSQALDRALRFAHELTGLVKGQKPSITFIGGTLDDLGTQGAGSKTLADHLAAFDIGKFQNINVDRDTAVSAASALMCTLGSVELSSDDAELRDQLFDWLSAMPVVNKLIAVTTGSAKRFPDLAKELFPDAAITTAERATEALLVLANYAHSKKKKRILLAARLHLFYRGLQGLFACINPTCSAASPVQTVRRLGRLWHAPRQFCSCGSRVYELLTHRDCGTEYLRGYVHHGRGLYDFLFHEKESPVGADEIRTNHHLREIHLLVGYNPNVIATGEARPVWLEKRTGRMVTGRPATESDYLQAWVADPVGVDPAKPHSFERRCPVCLDGWQAGRSKIMDLRTKGEQPFSAIVKEQLFLQPPGKDDPRTFPNQNRKVLLFSDGRQKAARLARDIPRDVEADSFREVLALAINALAELKKEPPLADATLYRGFVHIVANNNLSFFDGEDQRNLAKDVAFYRDKCGGNLEDAEALWSAAVPPERFKQALVRQLCSQYYSIPFAAVGWLKPRAVVMKKLIPELSQCGLPGTAAQWEEFVCAWLAGLAREYALRDFNKETIEAVAGFPKDSWGHRGEMAEPLVAILMAEGFTKAQVDQVNERILDWFCQQPDGNGLYQVNRSQIHLGIDLDSPWWHCDSCRGVHPYTPFGKCPACASPNLIKTDPNQDPYIRSRKGFWRNPIRECLAGKRNPKNVNAEEHTAQLSYRDATTIMATTEQHELLFQDIIINRTEESPVDILSCTTTMEVGIDIGSLIAVGLRNVPPQRENYQQRAGRAGRRGSAVSTVVTYCQGGPHDSHYFSNVGHIVSGPPRTPMITIGNEKIARRHVHAFLIQTYFLGFSGTTSAVLSSALGKTRAFFSDDHGQPCLEDFEQWIEKEVFARGGELAGKIVAWLPSAVTEDPKTWVLKTTREFAKTLKGLSADFRADEVEVEGGGEDEEDEDLESKFLEFLFEHGILPTYAFPTDICSFSVEGLEKGKVVVEQRPQQSLAKALSEYAPGRIVTIDKKDYKCVAVTANISTYETDRAAPLFGRTLKRYISCTTQGCSFVQETESDEQEVEGDCPLCGAELVSGEILQPEVFLPHRGKQNDRNDRDQDITYASPAQFPIPVNSDELGAEPIGPHAEKTFAPDRSLVIMNKGDAAEARGFAVCSKCGLTGLAESPPRPNHQRPYLISARRGPKPNSMCDGEIHKVHLGTEFKSDLMLLRIRAKAPLEVKPSPGIAAFGAFQHAMRTLAETLNLAASRRLDLDPSEFSSGFRVFPTTDSSQLVGEIYLFDTLAGGAGYSSQIGEELTEVLEKDVRGILSVCPDACERSCYSCLRHYGNQFYHSELDRTLGLALLDYALHDKLPALNQVSKQRDTLRPLGRMLELSGHQVSFTGSAPMDVAKGGINLQLGSIHGLYSNKSKREHPLVIAHGSTAEVINEFLLSRNLPAVHRMIAGKFL